MKTEKKTIKKIVAGALAFVCACTAGIVGLFHAVPETDGVDHNNQLSFGSFFGSGLSIVAASAETVDATSEGKTTLTATVTPAELAQYIKVDWAVSWQNAESEWAMGKTVTDYVTITPTTDGALTAEVECKKSFGEKVVVSVAVRGNETMCAECVCDYQIRPEYVDFVLWHSRSISPRSESIRLYADSDYTGNPEIWLTHDDFLNGFRFDYDGFVGTGTILDLSLYSCSFAFEPYGYFKFALEKYGFNVKESYNGSGVYDSSGFICSELLDSSVVSTLLKVKSCVVNNSIDSLTSSEVDTYMNYYSAINEIVGDDPVAYGSCIISTRDFEEIAWPSFEIHVSSDYILGLENIVESISMNSVLF